MSTLQPSYTASTALTITLASLATSATRVVGQESNVISNISSLYDDVLITAKITVGTTPTVSTQIDVWAYAPLTDDLASTVTYPDVFDGTDSAETITGSSEAIRNAALRLVGSMFVDSTTTDRSYYIAPTSLACLYGGNMPTRWGVFVTHNTGVNLNSTAGNHSINYVGIKYQSV